MDHVALQHTLKLLTALVLVFWTVVWVSNLYPWACPVVPGDYHILLNSTSWCCLCCTPEAHIKSSHEERVWRVYLFCLYLCYNQLRTRLPSCIGTASYTLATHRYSLRYSFKWESGKVQLWVKHADSHAKEQCLVFLCVGWKNWTGDEEGEATLYQGFVVKLQKSTFGERNLQCINHPPFTWTALFIVVINVVEAMANTRESPTWKKRFSNHLMVTNIMFQCLVAVLLEHNFSSIPHHELYCFKSNTQFCIAKCMCQLGRREECLT